MSMLSTQPIRRTRGPAIAWAPAHDSYYVLAGVLRNGRGTPPLHLTQSAILVLEAHLRESASSLPFGLLTGGLFVCPKTKLEYLLIDEAVRAPTELTADDPGAQLAEALHSLTLQATQRGKLTIGWYIGGMGAELQLDREAVGVHRELFREPWQVVLLHDRDASVETGALMRFEALTERSYAVPFFELLPEKSARGKETERRTAIRWANYRAAEEVVPLEEAARQIGEAGPAPAAPPSRARLKDWLQPFRRTDGEAVRQKTAPIEQSTSTSIKVPVEQAAPPARTREPVRQATLARTEAPFRPAPLARIEAPVRQAPPATIEAEPPTLPAAAAQPIAPVPPPPAAAPLLQPAAPRREVAMVDHPTVAPAPVAENVVPEAATAIATPAASSAVAVPEVATAVGVPEAPTAVPALAPGTQHVFIDGDLISFDELPPVFTDEQLFPSVYRRRNLAMAAVATVSVLVALGAYAMTRSF